MEVKQAPAVRLDEAIAALRLDRNGRIVDATVEAASMLGFAPRDLHGLSLGDLAADRWREMADGATARILLGETRSFQLLLRGRSGRRTLLEMVSKRIERTDEPGFVLAWSEPFPKIHAASVQSDAPELRRLANGLLRTREMERSRVSVELHNQVAPLILVAKYMIEDATRRLRDGNQAEGFDLLSGSIGRLRSVLDEVRRISTELRPSLLDDLGLLPTLEWLCRTFEQTYRTVRVELQVAVKESEIPENLKLVIFRITEELLINVAQHANASHVQVMLVRAGDELHLSVQDDGSGFDVSLLGYGAHQMSGIGLPSIRKRMESTGGRLALDSKPNQGSRIGAIWSLPLRLPSQQR